MKRVGICVIIVALITGALGCVGGDGNGSGGSYTLIVDFTAGGTVAVDDLPIPGKAILTYDAGTVVGLSASSSAGYRFVEWTGNASTVDDVNAASTTIVVDDDYYITANFAAETPTPEPSVLRVGGSGTYSSIQEAIDSVGSGDTIQVAQGTYLENISIETSKSFTLQGGWDSAFVSRSGNCSLTVIDGGASGSAIQIRGDPGVAIELAVEGFGIRNGIAEWGGGIRVASYGDSSIRLLLNNNLIGGNTATNRGGGISIESRGGSVNASVTNSIVAENIADAEGGGIRVESSNGGAATLTVATSVITNNAVTYLLESEGGWDGGGIAAYASGSGSTTVQAINNLVAANEAGFGGGFFGYAWGAEAVVRMTLTNNIITANRAQLGAGIISCCGTTCPVSTPGGLMNWVLTNNTITGNGGQSVGGIFMGSGSTFGDGGNTSLSMWNDIVYGNADQQVVLWLEPGRSGVVAANISYSDIGGIGAQGGSTWTADHVINRDPLFVDPANGVFLLDEGSPCIDSGDPDTVFNDGQRPPARGTERNDMGAYGGPENYDWLE